MIFLVEYQRQRGELVNITKFADADRGTAQNERLQRELNLHRERLEREVVLLQADDEEQLKKTHLRYFVDLATLIETELQRIAS